MNGFQSLQKIIKTSSSFVSTFWYLLMPATVACFLVIVACLDLYLQVDNKALAVLSSPIAMPNLAPYPVIGREFIPDISAQSAIVVDNDSKVVLYEKNADIRLSPASTTKIMTAVTSADYFHPEDILTVKTPFVEGSTAGLVLGEPLTYENMLYAMLLPSGNDAAVAISQNYPGGESAFIEKMNEKVQYLHLFNTHFGDPAGLVDDQDYTTARDLSRLAGVAIKNPLLAKIVDTKEKVVTSVDRTHVHIFHNLNELLGIDGVNGVKTGYTDEAGEVLVTSTTLNGHTLILVVMKSADRFLDTEKLISLISKNISYLSIHP